MTAFNKSIYVNRRLCRLHNLLFFVLALTCACTSDKKTDIHILWENNKAKGISISKKMTLDFNKDSIATFLKIRLLNDSIDILGNYRVENEIIFEPLIPFTRVILL